MAKKRKKKGERVSTPMSMSKALISIGASASKTEVALWYLAIFAISIVLGLLFNLNWVLLVLVALVYVLLTPKLIYNMKKRTVEKKRFDDVNSYLSQMAQSFTSTGNVLSSLKETEETFTEGKMRDAISEAIERIENFADNVRQAEVEALGIIQAGYDCERVRYLHDFLIKAESRGGECTAEFRILEKVRMAWSDAVLKYHGKLVAARDLVAIEYGLLLVVCMFFLRRFPDMISLINLTSIRVTNAIEIIGFLLVFIHMDNKLNASMLKDAVYMSEESVESSHTYIANFSAKKELKKNWWLIAISVVLGVVLVIIKPTVITGLLAVAFILLMFNLHWLTLWLCVNSMKDESTKAFPKWLFDIMLLIQSESVESAIFNSREFAPPVLKYELQRICESLEEKPGNVDAYMSFLSTYNIQGVEDTMRKLYSLSVGTGDKGIMEFIIDSNMSMLSEAENKTLQGKGDMSSMYTYLPVFCVSGALITYLVVLMIEVFSKLSGMMSAVGI